MACDPIERLILGKDASEADGWATEAYRHPIGASGEYGVTVAGAKTLKGRPVTFMPNTIRAESGGADHRTSGGNPRSDPRFSGTGGWRTAPMLRQHALHPQCGASLSGHLLGFLHSIRNGVYEQFVTEVRTNLRPREYQRGALGHGATKEDVRSFDDTLSPIRNAHGGRALPLPRTLDEVSRDRVGVDVGDSLDDGFFVEQLDAVEWFGVPQTAPTPAKYIDCPCDQRVQVLLEVRDVATGIGDHEVIVVGHHDERMEFDVMQSAG